ncbi:hypothetical protein GCM10023205_73410 [Yinghuangia aomiensis]|uniref:Uncharacterized protein n=1 Tax=Yinghuangia aomiensis TaxID=676205 RepID=A0ABP9I8X5_9ACTN
MIVDIPSTQAAALAESYRASLGDHLAASARAHAAFGTHVQAAVRAEERTLVRWHRSDTGEADRSRTRFLS